MRHKIETLLYAQGWLGTHIETHNDPFDVTETDDYRQHVQDMWQVIDEGLDDLRTENIALKATLALIDQARNTKV